MSWIWGSSAKKQKMSPAEEPRGAGAGSGAPALGGPSLRNPTPEEVEELDLLLDPVEITGDSVLAWLKAHPDVRVDYIPPDHDYGNEFHASILGALLKSHKVPAEHPVFAEALKRNPDLKGQTDVDGNTQLQKVRGDVEYMKKEAIRSGSVTEKRRTENLFNKWKLLINHLKKKGALRDLPMVTQLARQKGLDVGVESNIAEFLSGKKGDTETQRESLREEIGMTKKAGGRRKTKRGKKTRRIRRRM
jgi:hypothetical protein